MQMALIPAFNISRFRFYRYFINFGRADNITQTKHNSNRELIGQGIGNMVAGLFSGIAGAGATMRTVVNLKSGGKPNYRG